MTHKAVFTTIESYCLDYHEVHARDSLTRILLKVKIHNSLYQCYTMTQNFKIAERTGRVKMYVHKFFYGYEVNTDSARTGK